MRSAFRFCMILLAACFVGLPAPASALVSTTHSVSATSKPSAPVAVVASPASKAPASVPNTLPFTLTALAGIAGTTKRNLSRTYIFNGETYGPGNDIEVPEDFPEIDGETGDVIHEPGSVAERNLRASARANNSEAPTQGLSAGTNTTGNPTNTTVSGKTSAELEEMTKADLVALAEKSGVTVTREDGSDGEPLKSDYVAALGATA